MCPNRMGHLRNPGSESILESHGGKCMRSIKLKIPANGSSLRHFYTSSLISSDNF